MRELGTSDFLRPGQIIQLGREPNRVDLLTELKGVSFPDCYMRRLTVQWDQLVIPVISRQDLILNKQAVGRPQDLLDVQVLEAQGPD